MPAWRFDEFEIDPARYELSRQGTPVPVEPQVFEVLAYLVANRDRVVSRDDLIAHVWPGGFISDGALSTRISSARKAIGDSGGEQRLIRTVHGRGFRFVGDVVAVETAAPAFAPTPVAAEPTDAVPMPRTAPARVRVPGTSFLGRASEVADLERLLAGPERRLITIHGPGGTGKTRLVAHLAEQLENAGRDVAVAELQSVDSLPGLLTAVATALGFSRSFVDASAMAAALGDRDVVLILDNFEQLVGEAAGAIAELFGRSPGLRIVLTSRVVLGLQEEWLFPLGGLSTEADNGDSDAVRLFLEREAVARGSPEPADDAVRAICRLADGLPLAIELAASLRRHLGRGDVARMIAEDAGALETGLRNLPERHRALSTLFEESLARLTDDQRRALSAAAVFEGSFDLEAAAAITGASYRTMAALADHALVQASDGRFSLHPLLRRYAGEAFGNGRDAIEGAHTEYYLRGLEARVEELSFAGQAEASAEIAANLPDIMAAWRRACARGRLDLVERAAYPLFLFAQMRSRWATLRDSFEQAVAIVRAAGEAHWRLLANLLVYLTWARIRTSLGPSVQDSFSEAVGLLAAHDAPPPPGPGCDTVALEALLHWSAGRYDRMRDLAEEARRRAAARGDLLGEAYALWLGATARNRSARLRWTGTRDMVGSYRPADRESEELLGEARWMLDRATVLLSSRGEQAFQSYLLHERQWNAKCAGDVQDAVRLGRQSYEIRRAFGDRRGMADALMELMGSYRLLGDLEGAQACLAEAEQIVSRLGDFGGVTEVQRSRAATAFSKGHLHEALALGADAIVSSLEAGAVNNALSSLRTVAVSLYELGQRDTSLEISALIALHPASTPFTRAGSEALLNEAAQTLGEAAIEGYRLRARSLQLAPYGREIARRFGRDGATSAARGLPLPGDD